MEIKSDSVVRVYIEGGWAPRFSRDIKLAELPQEKKDRVIELLQSILANPTPTPGGGTSSAYEILLDGQSITECPQFHSVPGGQAIVNLATIGCETFKTEDKFNFR